MGANERKSDEGKRDHVTVRILISHLAIVICHYWNAHLPPLPSPRHSALAAPPFVELCQSTGFRGVDRLFTMRRAMFDDVF